MLCVSSDKIIKVPNEPILNNQNAASERAETWKTTV